MTDTVRMADNTPRLLTVAVTSRALFDLEESHALYEREGVQAYSDYQRTHEDDVLAPGMAALKALTADDLHPESEALAALLEQLGRIARATSDELTLKFFSHALSRSVLSLVA